MFLVKIENNRYTRFSSKTRLITVESDEPLTKDVVELFRTNPEVLGIEGLSTNPA
jgi:hypothetical protein